MRVTITEESAAPWAMDLPEGVTLGEMLEYQAIRGCVALVQVNSDELLDWRSYCPAPGDLIHLFLLPGELGTAG